MKPLAALARAIGLAVMAPGALLMIVGSVLLEWGTLRRPDVRRW